MSFRICPVVNLLPTQVRHSLLRASPGLAAFHLSQNPDLTPEEVEALLKATAVDVGPPGKDPQTGWGAVQ